MQYSNKHTAVIVVDPYNDFLSKKGLAWPLVKSVVKKNDMINHQIQIVAAACK